MNLLDLYAKIALDTSAYEDGIKEAGGTATRFAEKLRGGFTAAAKVATAALGAASTAAGALGKASLDGYSSFEQLVGGVETLFQRSAGLVQAYADEAYRTAGLSANAYMETVTGFSASLLQSLGGDTGAAAEMANLAITDMADNANKMGTAMESIQNAYQGFAKANFTMLDNLKLGYGGTKEEMQRLLDDAEKLSGIQYDISSFADIVDAVHVIQSEMGITGTTAKEASSTIQGSADAAAGAWSNLVTGIADENADLDRLTGNFAASVETLAGNVVPRVQQILAGMGSAIDRLAPVISSALPGLVSSVLPHLLTAGGQLLEGVARGLLTALPAFGQAALQAVSALGAYLYESAPVLLAAGEALLPSLAEGLRTALPAFAANALPALVAFTGGLREGAGQLIDAGIALVLSLCDGLMTALPDLIANAPLIVSNLAGVINDNAPKLLAAGVTLVIKLAEGLLSAVPELVKNAPRIIAAIVDTIMAFNWLSLGGKIITGIQNGIANAASTLTGAFHNLVQNAASIVQNWGWQGLGKGILQALKLGVESLKGSFLSLFQNILLSVKDAFGSFNWQQLGSAIIHGLIGGIKGVLSNLWSTVTSVATGIVDAFKRPLEIHSPSKVFAGIGGNVVQGLVEGIEQTAPQAEAAIQRLAESVTETAGQAVQTVSERWSQIQSEANGGVIGMAQSLFSSIKNAVENQDWLSLAGSIGKLIFGLGLSAETRGDVLSWVSDAVQQINAGFETGGAKGLLEAGKAIVQKLADGFASGESVFLAAAQELLGGLGSLIDGVLPGVGQAVSALGSAFTALVPGIDAAAASTGIFNTILSANPILLVIGLIAALMTALYHLGQANTELGATARKVWNGIGQVVDAVINTILFNLGLLIQGFVTGINALIWVANLIPGVELSPVQNPVWGLMGSHFPQMGEPDGTDAPDYSVPAPDYGSGGNGSGSGASGGTTIERVEIYIEGAKYDDPASLAEAISMELQNLTERSISVFA